MTSASEGCALVVMVRTCVLNPTHTPYELDTPYEVNVFSFMTITVGITVSQLMHKNPHMNTHGIRKGVVANSVV